MGADLIRYIEEFNQLQQMFAGKCGFPSEPISTDKPLSEMDRKYLVEQLECDLSPENLCCDGELRGVKLARKTRYLNSVAKELGIR